MKLRLCIVLLVFVFSFSLAKAQNLLDTSTWTIGSGSVSGFSQNGATSENSRELGTDPFGDSSVLWKGGNDADSNADGGWNSSYHNINNEETYRFVVWLKKTNSNDGNSYFGCQQWQSSSDTNLHDYTILKLDGEIRPNPYFWVGDLPQLNKWYMLVGYIHGKNYSSDLSYGGIYDPVTGTKVVNITDYKFAPTTTKIRHRAFLYYDTNTSDRQYFYAPRAEMVDGNEPPLADLLGLNGPNYNTNILNTSYWTEGTSDWGVIYFNNYGSEAENERVWGENHVGEETLLWKSKSDGDNGPNGGWDSYNMLLGYPFYHRPVRFSVWIKKTNSHDGMTFFGYNAYGSGYYNSIPLDGNFSDYSHPNDPYFFAGDLPKLNRWYLLVGYVHEYGYTGTANLGRIYDGVTGEEVQELRDYKFHNTVSQVRHRAYLSNDTNTNDIQYYCNPRIEYADGNELPIEELLSINPDSKLIFSYDLAGNQKQRFYCEEEGFCSPIAPESRMINEEGVKMEEEGVIVAEQTDVPLPGEETKEEIDLLDVKHAVYPNPTDGKIAIKLSGKDYNLTNSINIYTSSGALVRRININNPTNYIELNISDIPSGTYHIHMHFTNGTVKTEQIIKN